jgi:single-strand DNA-binding protein
MRSVNKVILIGNLTREPELRQTPNGQVVCTFGLATNREWMAKDSEKHSSAEFHELVAWARLADICGKYLKKGKLIYVEGYLKTRSWDTPEGIRRHKTEIIVQDMIMLEKRQEEEEPSETAPPPRQERKVTAPAELSATPGTPKPEPASSAEDDLFGGGLPGEESEPMPDETKEEGSVDM